MNTVIKRKGGLLIGLMTVFLLCGWCLQAQAVVDGVTGTVFSLVATEDYIKTPDPDSIYMWGFAIEGQQMQYPGPTLIVNQGVPITVNLRNDLNPDLMQNVSIVFPGQVVTATGGVAGALTQEAGYVDNPDGNPITVSYSFTPAEPGTYLYRSGTRADLQVEMGLVGALIVRPVGANIPNPAGKLPYSPPMKLAYNHDGSAYHHEYLYLSTELDKDIHRLVETGRIAEVDMTKWYPVHWFLNGRAFPDLLQPANWFTLPRQPYNCVPRTHPFETVLIRVINAGKQLHPIHYHGSDFSTIAVDGRMLSSDGGAAGPDLAWQASTINFTPGQTADLLWKWTGENIGWDVFGHVPGQVIPAEMDFLTMGYESPFGHNELFPIILAERDDLAFGQFWSGSPWLGATGDLPQGHPGFNSGGALFFPWHSHSEKELTSNDIFPGGTLSFVMIENPCTPIYTAANPDPQSGYAHPNPGCAP